MGNGVFISRQALSGFSENTRIEVLAAIGVNLGVGTGPVSNLERFDGTLITAQFDDDGPPDLTPAMARRLVADPISPKTIAVLKVIAASATPEFHLRDAVSAVEGAQNYRDISNVWSGITRRARKILNEDEADLVWWDGERTDVDGIYVDHVGRVSAMTHRSLSLALKGK